MEIGQFEVVFENSKITSASILTGPQNAITRAFSKTADVDHIDLDGKSYHGTSVLIGPNHPRSSAGLAFHETLEQVRHFSDPGFRSTIYHAALQNLS